MSLSNKTIAREAGSAYLAALFALLVLSVVGLTVSLVGQTELLIGTNERIKTRLLYAADSGISNAIGGLVPFYAYRENTVQLEDPTDAGLQVASRSNSVTVERILPIQTSPCALCQVNQGREYYKINHLVRVEARRDGSSRHRLSAMVELMPREEKIPLMNVVENENDISYGQ